MITFIPSWGVVSGANRSTDDLIGQLQSFAQYGGTHNILIGDYMPQLRYFLHRFDLLESPYHSVFDQLQGFEELQQVKLRLEDLPFPKPVSLFYEPWAVLVYQQGKLIGKVLIGDGAQIYEVQYFSDMEHTQSDIYDDRGHVSSRKFYASGEEIYTAYLDREGEEIFVCDAKTKACRVNVRNSRGLKSSYYESLDQLSWELLDTYLSQNEAEKIIVSLTDQNLPFVSRSPLLNQMILSHFGQRYSYTAVLQPLYRQAIQGAHAVLVDSKLHFNQTLLYRNNNVVSLPPFDARFTLSATQEMKEEVLYVEMRHLESKEWEPLLKHLMLYVLQAYRLSEQRLIKIILSSPWGRDTEIKATLSEIFYAQFPQEYEFLERQGLDGLLENQVDEELLTATYPDFLLVSRLQESFSAEVFYSDDDIFKVIHKTRLILDVAEVPDLFIQMAGISAGIPQINKTVSDYVYEEQNGLVLESLEGLEVALDYYLDTMKYWKIARVFSIQQIKQYSGLALYQELRCIIEGRHNGN